MVIDAHWTCSICPEFCLFKFFLLACNGLGRTWTWTCLSHLTMVSLCPFMSWRGTVSTLCTLHCNFCACCIIFTGGLNNGFVTCGTFFWRYEWIIQCASGHGTVIVNFCIKNRSWILVHRVTYDPLYVKNIDCPISLLQGHYVSQCGWHVVFLTCIHIYSRHRVSEQFGDFKHVMVFIEAARVLW